MTEKNIDNKLIPLAKRYSDAIVQVAAGKGQLDVIYSDLRNISEALSEVKELTDFLSHPVIPLNEKKETAKSVFEGKVQQDSLNLIYILLEKNKINLLDTILYCFESSMDEAKNILKVGVVSAVEIDEDLKARLKEKLEKKLNKEVKFDYEINPDIIAGIVLKIHDKTIDGSMSARLEGFKKSVR